MRQCESSVREGAGRQDVRSAAGGSAARGASEERRPWLRGCVHAGTGRNGRGSGGTKAHGDKGMSSVAWAPCSPLPPSAHLVGMRTGSEVVTKITQQRFLYASQ